MLAASLTSCGTSTHLDRSWDEERADVRRDGQHAGAMDQIHGPPDLGSSVSWVDPGNDSAEKFGSDERR